jgi:hypothetical protein
VFLVVGWEAFVWDRARLRWVVAAAAFIIVALLAQYFFIWRQVTSTEPDYWGHKYRVFYTHRKGQTFGVWFWEHYRGMAALPGLRQTLWSMHSHKRLLQWRRVDESLWVGLHFVGLARLALTKNARLLLLVLLPIAVHWVFNLLRLWPGGAFRTNLFLLGYTAVLAASALDWAWARAPRFDWLAPLPALLCVVAPYFAFDHTDSRKRTDASDTDFPEVLTKLATFAPERPKKDRAELLVNRRSSSLFTYYTELHPSLAHHLGKSILRRFNVTQVPKEQTLELLDEVAPEPPKRVWLLTDDPLLKIDKLIDDLPHIAIEQRYEARDHRLFEVSRLPDPAAADPATAIPTPPPAAENPTAPADAVDAIDAAPAAPADRDHAARSP